ncbi:MAG: hypothetical protein K0R51_3559 [Cytophagaceae bacterium]|jgi:hypothetical protein|nr:hypothetical protein [Cytophagaceae bacterium]
MKSILSLLLCLFILQSISHAQDTPVKLSPNFTVSTGPVYPMVESKFKYYFSLEPQFSIAIKRVGDQVCVQKFDNTTMSKLSEKMYNDIGRHDIEKVMQSGDKIYYIYSWVDKLSKKKTLYARAVNKEGEMLPVKTLCATASDMVMIGWVSIDAVSGAAGIRYEITESTDKSKILVRYKLAKMSKIDSKNFESFGFAVIDAATLEKQWEGEIRMPFSELDMNNLAFAVTKNGNVHLLTYVSSIKEFQMMVLHPDLSLSTYKVDIKALEIEEFKIQELEDGNLLCSGYFANGIDIIYAGSKIGMIGFTKTKSFNTNGLVQLKLTPEGKILESHEHEFPIDLINQYEGERSKNKNNEREAIGKAGINDLKIVEMILIKDGTSIIVGEQQYIRTPYGGGWSYHYGDLIVMKLDPKGQLLWIKKLPKRQAGSSGMGGLSIKTFRGDGAFYMLFLDNIKNANLSVNDAPAAHSDDFGGGFLTAYKVDEGSGAVEKHNILNFRNVPGIIGVRFRNKNIIDTFPKTFMIEGIAKEDRENAMVTFKLKE